MDTRRLPLILLLVLLPVPAQADRHTMECFSGISREPEASAETVLAKRLSCGLRIEGATTSIAPSTNRSSLLSAITGANDQASTQPKVWKNALFVFLEAADYISGRDTGHSVDGLTLGARYYMGGQKRFEPFVHGSFGVRRPPRPDSTVFDSDDIPLLGAAALGGGADIESDVSILGWVLALRLQLDMAGAYPGFALHLRPTVGLSFRYERH